MAVSLATDEAEYVTGMALLWIENDAMMESR